MNRFTQPVCTCLLVLLTGTVTAGQIYRSVDAEGNVTFSSEPPENATSVEEVDIPPGPSAEEQHEARERMQRQEATAGEMGEARANRAQQRSAETPAAGGADELESEIPVDQYYGYPYPNKTQRDKARDAIRERLQNRPVQLPARPVPR
jgi:hypothetical protein